MSAYSELVKNFEKIRSYMREFYVYGFKSRGEYDKKSARSYDDERRRMESWLGDYMGFRQTEDGKRVFLSIDSRLSRHNPLFRAWKTKSFTDGDITLHFILFDILSDPDIEMMASEYNRRRRYILNGLRDAGIECFEAEGAFYVFPYIGKFGLSSEEFCQRLLDEMNVAIVPGTAFGACGEGFARISYAYSVEHITKEVNAMGEFVKKLRK